MYASSSSVYGDDPKLSKAEAMAPRPLSPYAVQKLAGEYYASVYGRLFDLNIATLRYFNVYGPRQDPSSPYSGVISIFMERAVRSVSPEIYGDGRQSRDFIFVADVVRANLLAASAGRSKRGLYNIGTGRRLRINDLWEQIRAISGSTALPEYRDAREGDIQESLADIAKAKAELGFVPEVSFEDGLSVTFRWFKEAARRQEK